MARQETARAQLCEAAGPCVPDRLGQTRVFEPPGDRASSRGSLKISWDDGDIMANAVNPIPEGMHTITPHLVVNGASEYIDFLKRAFGAEEDMRAPGPGGKIMHAT